MPRTARSIHAGLYYHVLNRGNNRATVFNSPDDFDGFHRLMKRAQARRPVDILAACLMPNHFHLVVRPVAASDLSAWIHWLLTTHAKRHHRQRASSGRIWTSRFKAFPIQDDRHLLTVVRYVERNALRAALVAGAEEWPWGSLRWRFEERPVLRLAPLPIQLPGNWADVVNAPQTAAEIAEVRRCVNRGRPFGEANWVQMTATELGLTHTLGRRGRPPRTDRIDAAKVGSNAPPK